MKWRSVLLIIVLATLAGFGGAEMRLHSRLGVSVIELGPWLTSRDIGSADASPVLRAVIAVQGLLALNRNEALYFEAHNDSSGQPLSGSCRYRVEGHDPPSRWWSITAYAQNRFLIPNPGHRYSVNGGTAIHDSQGNFVLRLSTEPQAGDWIALPAGQPFVLNLRAYVPTPEWVRDPGNTTLPAIIRESCQ
jgi:hypothetical protein